MKNTKKEKKNSRKNHKYPALIPELNLKTRRDEIADVYSYIDTLNEEEKEWLNRFVTEEIICSMDHDGEKLNKELTNLPKDQKSPEEIKTRQRLNLKNNARNRCVYTKEAAHGAMNYLEDIEQKEESETEFETFAGEKYN